MNLGAGELATIIVTVLLFGAFLLWGNRPTAERFAEVNGLELDDATRPQVAMALRRTYRGRVFGGAGSFVVAVGLAALGASRLNFTGGLAAIFAGSLIGIAFAQVDHSPATDGMRIASLEARDPHDYRPRWAVAAIGVALVVMVGYGIAMIAAYDQNRTRAVVTAIVVGALSVATVIAGIWLQRRIVEQAQDHRNPAHAQVDDALRASAVRAVHHAVLGILLCGIALLGVTGATTTDQLQVERDGKVLMTLPAGTLRAGLEFSGEHAWVRWTDADGAARSVTLPPNGRKPYLLVGRITSGSSLEISPVVQIGFFLAFLSGFAALFEWRQAARSWRRPSPRHRSDPTTASSLATNGASS